MPPKTTSGGGHRIIGGNKPPDERRPDIYTRTRAKAAHHRCCRYAGGIEAGDRRTILAQHASLVVGNNPAQRANITRDDLDRVERPFADFAERFIGLVERIAQPAIIGARAAVEIGVVIVGDEAVEAVDRRAQRGRIDLERGS